jgi:hypothetical protein
MSSHDINRDEMWRGFADAVIRIELPAGPHRIEPRPAGDVGEFPLDGTVHIVTAHNPAGRAATEHDNRTRHSQLTLAIDGRTSWPTVGSAPDGSMPEPGFAISGLDPTAALELGRRFGQRAIYEWSAAALRIVGVDEPDVHTAGWRLIRLT